MNIKIIKTEEEYNLALERIELIFDCEPNPDEEDELELLSLLVEKYEQETCDMGLPDPIEAIKFRMEQQGLTRKDLSKYIGSMSKVSEVLNYKRPLSLSMIRALHEGLEISAEVLLNKPGEQLSSQKYMINDFPFTEMYKRNYFHFEGKLSVAKEQSEELLTDFFSVLEKQDYKLCARQADNGVGAVNILKAWQAQVLNLIMKDKLRGFESELLSDSFFERISRLSYFEHGPSLVKEALNKVGIHFIVLEHLPKTHLDGACFFAETGNPVIAMTIRHDRLDNFWFTLFHELGHLKLSHISMSDKRVFMDDTVKSREETNGQEDDADEFARTKLICPISFEKYRTELSKIKTDRKLMSWAIKLDISPAVLAGRVRWITKEYTKFSGLIGQGMVRKLFLT